MSAFKNKAEIVDAIRKDAEIIGKRVYDGELQKQANELLAKAAKASERMTKDELLDIYEGVSNFSWYAPHN